MIFSGRTAVSSSIVYAILASIVLSIVAVTVYVAISNTMKIQRTQSLIEQEKVSIVSSLSKIEITPKWIIFPEGLLIYEITHEDIKQKVNARLNIYEFSEPGRYVFKAREGLIIAYTDLNSTAYAIIVKARRPLMNASISNIEEALRYVNHGSAYITYWQSNVQIQLPTGQVVNIQLIPLIVANVPPWGKTKIKLLEPSYGFIADCKPFTNITEVARYLSRREVIVGEIDCLAIPKGSHVEFSVVEGGERHVGYAINHKLYVKKKLRIVIDSSSLEHTYYTSTAKLRLNLVKTRISNKLRYSCSWNFPAGTFAWSGVLKSGDVKSLTLPVGTICNLETINYSLVTFTSDKILCITDKCEYSRGKVSIKVYGDGEVKFTTYEKTFTDLKVVLKIPWHCKKGYSWIERVAVCSSTGSECIVKHYSSGSYGSFHLNMEVYNNLLSIYLLVKPSCSIDVDVIGGIHVNTDTVERCLWRSWSGECVEWDIFKAINIIPSTNTTVIIEVK